MQTSETDSGKIRNAAPGDKARWQEMWQGYQDYYEVDLSKTTQNTWERLMAPPPEGPFCLVYENEAGTLAGFTTYLFHGHTWQPEPRCYLVDLFTSGNVRGKGIGRALIEAVYAKADGNGCSSVYWLTQDFNEAGRRLYDKVGNLTPFIKYQR